MSKIGYKTDFKVKILNKEQNVRDNHKQMHNNSSNPLVNKTDNNKVSKNILHSCKITKQSRLTLFQAMDFMFMENKYGALIITRIKLTCKYVFYYNKRIPNKRSIGTITYSQLNKQIYQFI